VRPKNFTVVASAGGTTYSPAYPIDTYINPCNIGIGVTVLYGVGSAVYDVQHTFSDPWSINLNASPATNTEATGVWINNSTLTSATATGDTNYAFPPRAIRFALRAAASASITGHIQQAGPEE
jgi:hypothetical protein